jgi:serine protease Do
MLNTKQNIKKIFLIVIIASVLIGGVIGGVVGGVMTLVLYPNLNSARITSTTPNKEDKTILPKQNNGEEKSAEDTTVSVVEKALPAVVSIIATQELKQLPRSSFFNDFFFGFPFDQFAPTDPNQDTQPQPQTQKQQVSSGSGFIVTADGLVITNRHVVDNKDAEYTVVLGSGETYPAEVVDRDTVQDLAVVRIKIKDGEIKKMAPFPTLLLGDSDSVKIGETVIAIGNTLGEFRNTVTRGIVSGINRTLTAGDGGGGSEVIEGAIQTDAAISSGNSGGPLLDLQGLVVGVNTAVSSSGENIGFALPVDQVKIVLESVQKYGKIVRPFLGVRYMLLDEEIAKKNNMKVTEGALVVRGESREDLAVVPGSPADKAGIKENDIIVDINGVKVSKGHSLQEILSRSKPGDIITVTINRAGEILKKQVKLEDRGEF